MKNVAMIVSMPGMRSGYRIGKVIAYKRITYTAVTVKPFLPNLSD